MKHLPTIRRGHTSAVRAMEHPFDMHRSMSDLFEGLFKGFGEIRLPSVERLWREPGLISPKFNISESPEAYNVKAELPGLEEKDIELTLDHDTLVLKGEKKQEREQKRKNYFFSEHKTGQFYREIPMPWGVDSDKVKATFRKGVLKVNLPKMEKAKIEKRRVKITSE